ncbi:MAG TPA: hypothetical protein VF026_08705 [Ktedonobacteraceae bacterium]
MAAPRKRPGRGFVPVGEGTLASPPIRTNFRRVAVAPHQDDRKGSSILYISKLAVSIQGTSPAPGRPQGIVPPLGRISPPSPWRRSAGLAPVLGWCGNPLLSL